MQAKELNRKLLETALSQYGVREKAGRRHHRAILEYFKAAGYPSIHRDEVAWCAAFINWVLDKNGLEKSGKLTARSLLSVGKKVDRPKQGDLVVFWRGSRSSWKGHVGLYINDIGDYVYTLGGNQSNQVNISPYPKYRVLGYRRLLSRDQDDKKILECTHKRIDFKPSLLRQVPIMFSLWQINVDLFFVGTEATDYSNKIEVELSNIFALNFRISDTTVLPEKLTEEHPKKILEILKNKGLEIGKKLNKISIFITNLDTLQNGFSVAKDNSIFVTPSAVNKYSSAIAHHVGHLFGLNHVDDMSKKEFKSLDLHLTPDTKFNLMSSNVYGKHLTPKQLNYAKTYYLSN